MHIASNIGLQSRMTLRRKTNVYTMQNTFTQLNSNLALQIHATWNSTVISSLHFLGMTEIITWGSRNPGRLAGTQNKYISHIHKLKRNHEHFETIYYLVNRKATSPSSYSLLVISTPHSEHADDKQASLILDFCRAPSSPSFEHFPEHLLIPQEEGISLKVKLHSTKWPH